MRSKNIVFNRLNREQNKNIKRLMRSKIYDVIEVNGIGYIITDAKTFSEKLFPDCDYYEYTCGSNLICWYQVSCCLMGSGTLSLFSYNKSVLENVVCNKKYNWRQANRALAKLSFKGADDNE